MATFLRLRASLSPAGSSGQGLITTYWDSTGAAQTALATEAMARVRAMFNSLAGTLVGGTLLVFNPVLDEIEETNGQLVGQVVGTLPANVTFSNANTPLPAQTQALLRFATGTFVGGRALKGRMFLNGFTVNHLSSAGDLSTVVTNSLNTAVALLGTTVVTPMSQRVWHRPSTTTSGLSAVVTARSVASEWSVLRSRRD